MFDLFIFLDNDLVFLVIILTCNTFHIYYKLIYLTFSLIICSVHSDPWPVRSCDV